MGETWSRCPADLLQEKIVPRVIIENLRRFNSEDHSTLFFGDFDACMLPAGILTMRANWSNRMVSATSLQVWPRSRRREPPLQDPDDLHHRPIGIKFGSNRQVSTRPTGCQGGKVEVLHPEVDQIKAFRDTFELCIPLDLGFLRDRLAIARTCSP